MNDNVVNEKKSIFTIRRILKILSLLCIVFVFCPSFLVSCSSKTINVSVMTAVGGLSAYDEQLVPPHPIMLLALLIPVAIFVMLCLKKFAEKDKKLATIISICTVADAVIWICFRATAKSLAEENYCSFETTGWYAINMVVLVLIILLSAIVVVNKAGMDSDLVAFATGGEAQKTLNQMSEAVTKMSQTVTQMADSIGNKAQKEDTIGFCSKCGKPIMYGCKFCTYCGTPVPEQMIFEAEEARRKAEETVTDLEKAKDGEEFGTDEDAANETNE